MKTLLVFPPQAHPTQPALCLPSLVAYLRQHGYEDTHQWDINLEAHEYFLSRDRLAESRERVRERFEALPTDRPLPLRDMDRFRVLSEALTSADAVVDGIEDAKSLLRDAERFYDYDEYLRAVKVFDRAFRLVSAEHHPSTLTPHNFTLPYSIERLGDVVESLGDADANFFLEFFREHTLPRLREMKPDLLGISLTYTSQVIPGLALAALVKQEMPEIHIAVGGGLLAYIAEKMTKTGDVFDVLDSVIVLEGEGPLLDLVRAVEAGRPIDDVPNCIHRKDGEVVVNPNASPLSIDDLPTPVFDGLPMDRYFSPQLALPLAITRGCYWEKCAFCTLYKVIGPGYRERSLHKVMDDIEAVTKEWGSNVIYFIVEDMPPPVFKKLPNALRERDLDIRWWTDARLERNLFSKELCAELYDAGCRRIAFGFESASQRLLDLMEKGTSLEEADTIVRNLHEAGISITLYTMIGFPTETVDEARATLQWLRDHKDVVHEVSLRIFYIDHLSKVYAHPENYDVKSILHDPTKDLQVYYDWEPGSGMTRREARELFFEFMQVIRDEFPLFRGDNLQLFELKSHYFLYLCRHGDLSFLEDKCAVHVAEQPPEDLREACIRQPEGNRVFELPFDLREISDSLNRAECSILRPRYMSGNFKEDMFERLKDEWPDAEPRPTFVVYRARSGDLLHVGRDAARVLAALDGRPLFQVLEAWPEALRPRLAQFVAKLFDSGLVTARAGAHIESTPAQVVEQGNGRDLHVTDALPAAARDAETMHLHCKPSVG